MNAEELLAAMREANRKDGAFASVLRAVKPNLIVVVAALVGVCWLIVGLMDGAMDAVAKLVQMSATAATEQDPTRGIPTGMLEAVVSFLGHLLGGALLIPIVNALSMFGVKLLDDPPKPGVPEDVVKELIASGQRGQAAVNLVESAAKQTEETRSDP